MSLRLTHPDSLIGLSFGDRLRELLNALDLVDLVVSRLIYRDDVVIVAMIVVAIMIDTGVVRLSEKVCFVLFLFLIFLFPARIAL